jgi:hypothetical protein
MTQEGLEQRLELLEKKIARQEKVIYDLDAIREINDLMSKYQYLHTVAMFAEHADLFAKRDDSFVQVGTWGMYKGWESIRRLYAGVHARLYVPGHMDEHVNTTPMVVVAGDGKTAKGVWICPGHDSFVDAETGEPDAAWCWIKYGCDFIKMDDGKWYIWHLLVFLTFYTTYDTPWTVGGEHVLADPAASMPPELKPDAPSLPWHDPYTPGQEREFLPAFPLPYETYDEKEGINWMNPKPFRRKMYPNDLEKPANAWPDGGWK